MDQFSYPITLYLQLRGIRLRLPNPSPFPLIQGFFAFSQFVAFGTSSTFSDIDI